jgi:hypothetical protein
VPDTDSALPELELKKAQGAAGLTPAARRAHRDILRGFARAGRPPSRAELPPGTDVALAELLDADLIVLNAAGEIAAAYPFSATPTAHRLSLADGTAVYAMCAIDALGASAMLGQLVTVTSTEPGSGARITVRVDGDTADWRPAGAVLYAARTGDCCAPSAVRSCGYINFFTTEHAARAWAGRHPELTGVVLGQVEALACGMLVALPVPWSVLRRNGILVDADERGLLYQIFTRPITERDTFFFEFIQRAGATGFGANNVRALYDALQATLAEHRPAALRGL